MDDARSSEKERDYLAARLRMLERDQETCQFCDIKIPGHMEGHHISGDHGNNTPENLVTTCRLCHLAHHIGYVGVKKSGILIRLPGIQQSELNHLLRTLWIGEEAKLMSIRDQASSLLRALVLTSQGAEAILGFSDPKLLGDYLLRLKPDEYRRRISILKDIKILYNREEFEDHIDAVRPLYAGYPTSQWRKLAAVFNDTN